SVRLLAPDDTVLDSHSYLENPGSGIAWSRYPDGGDWRNDLPQSPGQTNPQPPTATPTATFTPTPTITNTPQPQASATHTATPIPIPDGVRINEYLAAPASGAIEYVELFNSNPFDVDLSGWQIDDIAGGSSPYSIPLDTFIPAQSFYLALRDLGLNNSEDTVRLIAPDGYVELFNHQSLTHFTFLYHKNEHLCYSVAND
ncbi:MAG: lamin tail domain-containing protein, partial [Chloroflexi bacterium]|nr:lamin tail domain-containing protein [Chloroflexota bacterium]